MVLRNIEVTWRSPERNNSQFGTQTFIDWYDFADWLKQRELANEIICIKGWRYLDRRI